MKSIKISLTLVVIIIIGTILSSCSIGGKYSNTKLYNGIQFCNLEEVKEALKEGANINKIGGTFFTESNPLRLAFNENGDAKIAEYLINKGADVNYTDKQGISLLMFKTYNTDVYFCDLLLKHGAKINQKDKLGNTALEYALRAGVKSSTVQEIDRLITLILNKGAKITPNTLKAALTAHGDKEGDGYYRYRIVKRVLEGLKEAGYKSGLDPVLEAAILGDSNKVEELIKRNEMKKEDEEQVLFYTAAFGRLETIKLLEDRGVDLKSCDSIKNSPLAIAAEHGQLEIVKYLLSKGANIEAQNKDNKTALILAVENNQYDVTECLIKNKANIKPYKNFATTYDVLCEAAENGNINMIKLIIKSEYPLNDKNIGLAMGAAVDKDKVEVLKYFIENGANPDLEYIGFTPLEDACHSGNLEAVKFLVENGASVDGKKIKGSALSTAAEYGNTEIVEYLIKKGADVNAVPKYDDGSEGQTALTGAVMDGYFDIVKLLVEHGANLEYNDANGDKQTIIITAAKKGSLNIVKYLIEKGANLKHKNAKGETALDVAKKNNINKDIVKTLQSAK